MERFVGTPSLFLGVGARFALRMPASLAACARLGEVVLVVWPVMVVVRVRVRVAALMRAPAPRCVS